MLHAYVTEFFTDGLKTVCGVGAGILHIIAELYCLPGFVSVFQNYR